MNELASGKFKGEDIKNDHATKKFFTKLAKKQEDLALSTTAEDICKIKLQALVRKLSCDLKDDTFDEATVNTIEMVRNVTDVRKFALEVKKHGAVKTGHKFGNLFLSSVRQLTGSVDNIPDIEIKENFN